jgi:SanA protein
MDREKHPALRRWAFRGLIGSGLAIIMLLCCDLIIRRSTSGSLHDTIGSIPVNEVGLVLGTSDRARGGGTNLFFKHRIESAVALFRAGKVNHLLVSGDNGTLSYNEPRQMRRALMAAGIDSSRITLDFAGFRTLDSVVRAKEVFGQSRLTIISQRFHNERAVFIARRYGIDAIGFNAPDPPAWWGIRTWFRERLARVKVFTDLALGAKPRFLGEPIAIPSAADLLIDPPASAPIDSAATNPRIGGA